MSLSQFYIDWFGIHGGREILLTYSSEARDRLFIKSAEELEDYVNVCRASGAPAYVSAQPYAARDQPFGIEKLFFEFDCPDDPNRAWGDAKALADSITRYYGAAPLLKFSGRKGYHVDLFLKRTVAFDPNIHPLDFMKEIYARLQEKILLGLNLATLDRQVLGDLKRLERVPYSTHEKNGQLCQPVDLNGVPVPWEKCDVSYYRENGLSTCLIQDIIRELKSEEKWNALLKSRIGKYNSNIEKGKIRPCIENLFSYPEPPHLMRVALVAECYAAGFKPEEIIEMFRCFKDFNEQKTRYQVMDIIEGGYRPFTCRKIKKLGYCLGEKCRKAGRGELEVEETEEIIETEEREFEEFSARALRLRRKGAFENMLAQHLVLSVGAEPLRKVRLICEAAFMVPEGKLQIDKQQLEAVYKVVLSFLNSNMTKEGTISIAWGFPLTEESYEKYVAPWQKSNVPLIISGDYKRAEVKSREEKFLYETYSLDLYPASFYFLKAEFLSWAIPIVMRVYEQLSRLVDPDLYREMLQAVRGMGAEEGESEGSLG
ncbi:hypothetical protein KEJ34_07685 [Candidatus Bathyarchaeota archaeon]|nr:hypothetical protein [Candidatus Bathyarchaeota archaeon]